MSSNEHIIPLSEAKTITHNFQNAPEFQGMTVASKISAQAYSILLEQPECTGVRTYFALKEGRLTIVVVGVNSQGNDITEGIILDVGMDCPPTCPHESELML